MERHLYTEIKEIFFASFPSKLHEWIMKLADNQATSGLNKPIVWTLELVHRLEALVDKIARAADHWLNRIIGGFIT